LWTKKTDGAAAAAILGTAAILVMCLYMCQQRKVSFRKKMGEVKDSAMQYEFADITQYDDISVLGSYGAAAESESSGLIGN
jgi:hypothetical protein